MKISGKYFLTMLLLISTISCEKNEVDPNEGFVKDPDGVEYQWKKMPDGNLWLVENLGYHIPNESRPYANEASYRKQYGLLYSVEGAIEACLALGDGWRLATDREWYELASYYGDFEKENEQIYRALVDPQEVSEKGTGESGFNGRFGGYYNPQGDFDYLGKGGFYWTASRKSSGSYWHYVFDGIEERFVRFHMTETWGFSCRCVKEVE